MSNGPMFIIFDPTGAGKTDLALRIAEHISAKIVNMDMGQFYMPLSIGTTKSAKNLKHIEMQKELSFGEKNLLSQIEALLVEEISLVNNYENR